MKTQKSQTRTFEVGWCTPQLNRPVQVKLASTHLQYNDPSNSPATTTDNLVSSVLDMVQVSF